MLLKILLKSIFCYWYFTVYVSIQTEGKTSAFVSSQVLFLDFHALSQSLAVNMARARIFFF